MFHNFHFRPPSSLLVVVFPPTPPMEHTHTHTLISIYKKEYKINISNFPIINICDRKKGNKNNFYKNND